MSPRKNRDNRIDIGAFASLPAPRAEVASPSRGSSNQSAGSERFANGTPCEAQPVGVVKDFESVDPDEEADTLVFSRVYCDELGDEVAPVEREIEVRRLSRPVVDLTAEASEPATEAATQRIGAGLIERDRVHRRNVIALVVLCVLVALAVVLLPRTPREVPARPDRSGLFGAPEQPAKADADPRSRRAR